MTAPSTNSKKSSRTSGQGRVRQLGLRFARYFSNGDPYKDIAWERRSAEIKSEKGNTVFSQHDVEVPDFWSQMATNVVVSKYFRGKSGTPERETSVRQVVDRVAGTIARWGTEEGYFASREDADVFYDELRWLLVNQHVSFNSPVWFNLGVPSARRQQVSACFINSVEDTLESILELNKTEGMLFKYGSGAGSNLSNLRSSAESLAGGGIASGPVSFMKGFDAFAGVIKSGGTTRRAAKMVILNADHPDIEAFVQCKVTEEKKAHALIAQGYDASFTGEAYASVFFQNSNNSVRVTDEFMSAVEEDKDWELRAVADGRVVKTMKARELMRLIAECAWQCGDPGMQYDTTINNWHTVPASGRINASNPCAEFMHLDDTSCNLASLNLLRFLDEGRVFGIERFKNAVATVITAMEIMVGRADYPTERITKNSHDFRPLGLGYANLGALLMAMGHAYDSDGGRGTAAAVTAVMGGEAYAQSARIAEHMGPFAGYEANREPMLNVIHMHSAAVWLIPEADVDHTLLLAARGAWDDASALGREHGFRNSQATVLAPCGTISFMMDCDTTGVEPDIALVKYKKLVGEGMLKIVNQTVPLALTHLGYAPDDVDAIVAYINDRDTIEGAPGLQDQHLSVFDCAFTPNNGTRSISCTGHLKMMAAVQPYLSGAISKTINVPSDASIDDIAEAYLTGWRLGLKAVAVYRDGCKMSQPLATTMAKTTGSGAGAVHEVIVERPSRRRLPSERSALTHRFEVGGHEGYITVGLYEDGSPGEIFLRMAKEGSTISGVMDSFATVVSMALQYGVPLEALASKLSHTRFEPQGFTRNPEIPIAKSVMDYIFRWLASRFLPQETRASFGIIERDAGPSDAVLTVLRTPAPVGEGANETANTQQTMAIAPPTFATQEDAPTCVGCGSWMSRVAACYQCGNCGATSGCG